jgi:hypothetical protein
VIRFLLGIVLLGMVVPFAVKLYDAWLAPADIEPPPLDFKIVEKRYGEERLFTLRQEDVEKLLGPPTHRGVSGPDEEVRFSRQLSELPSDRRWDKWEGEGKWVLVLYVEGEVYYTLASFPRAPSIGD